MNLMNVFLNDSLCETISRMSLTAWIRIISSEQLETTAFFFFFWRDQCEIPPVLSWNAKSGDNRFSSWWVLGFVIPWLRQLVFPERVWLLAKWDDARNIAIWPASSYALLTHTHERIIAVTTMVHSSYLPPAKGRHEWTDEYACKTHSWPTWIIGEPTPELPDERFMLTQRALDMDQVTRSILISFPQPDDSLPARTPPLIISIHKQIPGQPE